MSTVRLPSRQRRWPAYVIAAIVLLGLLFTIMSQFYVDLLWFREVGYTTVFWTELRTKLLLGAAFGVVFFAVLYVNLLDRAAHRAHHAGSSRPTRKRSSGCARRSSRTCGG